jgi:hypothetical protein
VDDSAHILSRIHAQFAFHRQPTDADAQSAMDRVAQKCIGLLQRRSFNPGNCSVRQELLSRSMLDELQTYRQRLNPYPTNEPVVVLVFRDGKWS